MLIPKWDEYGRWTGGFTQYPDYENRESRHMEDAIHEMHERERWVMKREDYGLSSESEERWRIDMTGDVCPECGVGFAESIDADTLAHKCVDDDSESWKKKEEELRAKIKEIEKRGDGMQYGGVIMGVGIGVDEGTKLIGKIVKEELKRSLGSFPAEGIAHTTCSCGTVIVDQMELFEHRSLGHVIGENKMADKRDAPTIDPPKMQVWHELDKVDEKVRFLQEVTLELTTRLEPVSQPVTMKEEGRFAEDTSDLPKMAKRLCEIHTSLEIIGDAMLYAIQRLEI